MASDITVLPSYVAVMVCKEHVDRPELGVALTAHDPPPGLEFRVVEDFLGEGRRRDLAGYTCGIEDLEPMGRAVPCEDGVQDAAEQAVVLVARRGARKARVVGELRQDFDQGVPMRFGHGRNAEPVFGAGVEPVERAEPPLVRVQGGTLEVLAVGRGVHARVVEERRIEDRCVDLLPLPGLLPMQERLHHPR